MPSAVMTKEKAQKFLDRIIATGWPGITKVEAARRLGVPVGRVTRCTTEYADRLGLKVPSPAAFAPPLAALPTDEEQSAIDALSFQVKTLTTQLTAYKKDELNARYVRTQIMGLSEQPTAPPAWLVDNKISKNAPGVPTLMCSDWHHGEVIVPSQVGGVNEYNLEIAHKRQKMLITRTIDLLNNHMVNPNYPGIVMILGGDMVSGDIHEELTETNEIPLIPAMLDLVDVLVWCISTLADNFGKVFLPCVTGNHGRNTMKIRTKDRQYTSFDWLIYQILERHFKNDSRVSFLIPDGSDAYYRVYNHRYLLTHGDQFRGGDGIIGAIGPILRGDYKKRSRNGQIDMGYDTMILGHWHQLIQLQRLIVNGSLCGYNEYAYAGNFSFEQPKQALWLTHPHHGITFSMPVNVTDNQTVATAPWVSLKEHK